MIPPSRALDAPTALASWGRVEKDVLAFLDGHTPTVARRGGPLRGSRSHLSPRPPNRATAPPSTAVGGSRGSSPTAASGDPTNPNRFVPPPSFKPSPMR